ncbi:MAG: class A beta-lactamase-related serine hydrolase [Candidatus Omnitrophica bacterium]|nr:class A beta-lactamase-related serine hydrolase [Candidatus Omnitrophota bacterium]
MQRKTRFILIVSVCILLVIGIYWGYCYFIDYQSTSKHQKFYSERLSAWKNLKKILEDKIAEFDGDSAVLVKDLTMGWKYSYNKEKVFPAASLVKIPIMASCFLAEKEGKLSLKETITLKQKDKTGGSGILKSVKSGTYFTIEELIKIMIAHSDNTASNMLISRLGLEYINNACRQMGLRHTHLERKMMDFVARRQGKENYTSVEDIAYLLEKFYRGNFINARVSRKCMEFLKEQKIRDRIPKKLPPEVLIAHKTGLERRVCHDVGIVFTEKGDFLICVLTHSPQKASTVKDFIADLAWETYKQYCSSEVNNQPRLSLHYGK